jgi:hypothetical protein
MHHDPNRAGVCTIDNRSKIIFGAVRVICGAGKPYHTSLICFRPKSRVLCLTASVVQKGILHVGNDTAAQIASISSALAATHRSASCSDEGSDSRIQGPSTNDFVLVAAKDPEGYDKAIENFRVANSKP